MQQGIIVIIIKVHARQIVMFDIRIVGDIAILHKNPEEKRRERCGNVKERNC